ncbi:MAG: S-layer homology domain-containing protein [Ruminococcaceae bacterium]|nr:S-layer homology domain-containing protein [Oscillospiraceae bacterium]
MRRKVWSLLLALCLTVSLATTAWAAKEFGPINRLRFEGTTVKWDAVEGANKYYAGLMRLEGNMAVMVKSLETTATSVSFENELKPYRQDLDTKFMVGVYALKTAQYNESPVYYTEAVAGLYLAQGYKTPMALSGEASIGVPYPGYYLRPTFSGTLYQAWRENESAVHYRWQISDSAAGSFADISGERERTHVVEGGEIGKYLRVVVTAEGYSGQIVSNVVRVEKGFPLPAERPQLSVGSNSRTGKPIIVVTNAKAHQEYTCTTVETRAPTEAFWRDAVSPSSDGMLSLNCTPGAVNYVYTRSKETATHAAGTELLRESAYIAETTAAAAAEVSSLRLEITGRERFGSSNAKYMVDDILEVTVSALPEGTAFKGIRADGWLWNFNTVNEFGNAAFYGDPGCKVPLEAGQYYTKAYIRLASAGAAKKLGVQYRLDNGELLTANQSLDVADEYGQYEISMVLLPTDLTVTAGDKVEGFQVQWMPEEAVMRNLDFDAGQSGAPLITFDEDTQTLTVDATAAKAGKYHYTAYVGRAEMDDMIVTVEARTAGAAEVSISAPQILPLTPGQRADAGVTVDPESAFASLVWMVEKPNLISVKDGFVTASPDAPYGATSTITVYTGTAGVTATILVVIVNEEGDVGVGDGGETAFTDVPSGAYYADAVAWAVETGVTKGTSETTFSPNDTLTRAQAVTFLWRAKGSPAPTSSYNPFADVKAGAYYYDAVLWAVENGITNGVSADEFSVDGKVTRGQMITFLWRTEGRPFDTGGKWYEAAESWAVSRRLLSGTAEDYTTDGKCPRSDVVYYLYRDLAQ